MNLKLSPDELHLSGGSVWWGPPRMCCRFEQRGGDLETPPEGTVRDQQEKNEGAAKGQGVLSGGYSSYEGVGDASRFGVFLQLCSAT